MNKHDLIFMQFIPRCVCM